MEGESAAVGELDLERHGVAVGGCVRVDVVGVTTRSVWLSGLALSRHQICCDEVGEVQHAVVESAVEPHAWVPAPRAYGEPSSPVQSTAVPDAELRIWLVSRCQPGCRPPLAVNGLTMSRIVGGESTACSTLVMVVRATVRKPALFVSSLCQHLIPPFLGPMRAAPGLAQVLGDSPFEQNVMLITRFPKDPEDHFSKLIPKLREAVAAHGLRLLVASDGMKEDTLWANVVTYMWACKYAIVLLDKPGEALNSNVLIEVGGMLMTGRRCAILRDNSVPAMPSDLVGHIYKATDLADHEASVDEIHKWIRDDLGLGECGSCPSKEAA